MADTRNYVIKNVTRKPAMIDGEPIGPVYDYISQDRGTPVAYSREMALEVARAMDIPEDAVIPVPDDTVVILDRSARKLPQSRDVGTQVVQAGVRLQ